MDARLPTIQAFGDRLKRMKAIVKTIKSISYQPVQDDELLKLADDIKLSVRTRLFECYGDELNAVDTSPPTAMFGCFFPKINWNPERREKKILMSKVLMDACNIEFSSLLQINYFLTLLIEMKKSDEFIDPGHNRFHGMITSRDINRLILHMQVTHQTLDRSSSGDFKDLYKKIFYLKILRDQPSFSDKKDVVSKVLSKVSDVHHFFGDKEKGCVPLAYEGPEQLDAVYAKLDAERKNRLKHTLEYELFSGFKEKNLINVVRFVAIVEVLHRFIDELEVKQKKCVFKVLAKLRAESSADALFSGVQAKEKFCLQILQEGASRHLNIEDLRYELDAFKDSTVDYLDTKTLFADIRGVIGKHAEKAYKFPKSAASSSSPDKESHIEGLIEKEGLNPHLQHHHEQVLLSQEWARELSRLSDELLDQLVSVSRLVDEFFIPQNFSRKDVKVRDLDNLLDGVLDIIKKHADPEASPPVVRRLGFS
ncbi:MAG: hypothetical protein WAW86_05525 [Gammaproteobacteria bacterium]